MSLLILFGNRGIVDNIHMRQKLEAVKKTNEAIMTENRELKKRIILLQTNLPYIETAARNEMGMVKKGDMVYRFAK